jgi:DNA transformation protein
VSDIVNDAIKLADLPGLGPKSQRMLRDAGILTLRDLRSLGAVEAYLRVKRDANNASLNLLWAMEGVLSGRSWRDVVKTERLRLLLELEDRRHVAASRHAESARPPRQQSAHDRRDK